MRISKRLLALLAGGSAVGVGAATAGVTAQESPTPDPVQLGIQSTPSPDSSLDIEGDQVRVEASPSPLDDILDSANTGGSPDTAGTGSSQSVGTASSDTSGTESAQSAQTPDTPDTADTGDNDSPDVDNSGPGSQNSGPGNAESADSPDGDNSGPGDGDDNSGSGS